MSQRPGIGLEEYRPLSAGVGVETTVPMTSPAQGGPPVLGMAVESLEYLARGLDDCQARDGHKLASSRLLPFLDMDS